MRLSTHNADLFSNYAAGLHANLQTYNQTCTLYKDVIISKLLY